MLISDLSSEQLLMLIVPALPNMWALKHAMYHDFPTTREKYRWMMACVFVPCLAGVAYYFVGRKHASKEKVDIRARLEAERAAAAEARAVAEAGGSVEAAAAEAGTAAEAGGAAEAGTAAQAEASLPPTGGQAPAAEEKAPAAQAQEFMPDGQSRPGKPEVRRGDDWSFGCPDDVKKP